MTEVKCKNCGCICHCSLQEHSDMYGVCSCQACACDKEVVQDDTEECETCQQMKQNVAIRIPKKKKNQVRVVKQEKKTTQKR